MTLTAAQQKLAEDNFGLVPMCARRFLGRGVDYEDLVGAGSVGLVKAAAGFDESLGYRFSTYAVPSIIGEMKRLFRDGGAVKIGRAAKEKAVLLLRIADGLEQETGAPPAVSAVAERAGLSLSETAALMGACLPTVSLTLDENADLDIPAPSHEEGLISRLDLASAVDRLSPDEKTLLSLRYDDNLTQTAVGERLGMTQVQVSRAEKRILGKLRKLME